MGKESDAEAAARRERDRVRREEEALQERKRQEEEAYQERLRRERFEAERRKRNQ
jgi:hypothetical protein